MTDETPTPEPTTSSDSEDTVAHMPFRLGDPADEVAEDVEGHGLFLNANEPVDEDVEDTEAHGQHLNANEPVDDDAEAHGMPLNANEPVDDDAAKRAADA